MGAYLKTIVGLVAAVAAAVLPGLTGEAMNAAGWVNVAVLVAGAVHVFNAENVPGWRYAKTVAAAVSAGGVVAVSALTDGVIAGPEWVQIVVALVSAAGVLGVRNSGTVNGVFVGHQGYPPARAA